MAHEGIPLPINQRQLGHYAHLGIMSIHLQGIDTREIVDTVHHRRPPCSQRARAYGRNKPPGCLWIKPAVLLGTLPHETLLSAGKDGSKTASLTPKELRSTMGGGSDAEPDPAPPSDGRRSRCDSRSRCNRPAHRLFRRRRWRRLPLTVLVGPWRRRRWRAAGGPHNGYRRRIWGRNRSKIGAGFLGNSGAARLLVWG